MKSDAPTNELPPTSSPRSASLLVLVGCAAITLVSLFRPLRDFDLPWNLATGRVIWATKAIPRVDDLAFTHGQLRYVEFVSDLLLYALFRVGQAWALQATSAIVALGILVLILAQLRPLGPISVLAVGAIAATVLPWCELRPATLSFAFLVMTLLVLERHRATPSQWRWLLVLVISQCLWANIHGFAAIGAAIILGYAGYRLLAHVAGGRWGAWLPERDGSSWQQSSGICAVAIGATCLNTAGPALLLGPFRFGEQLTNITEWARPTFHYFVNQQPIGSMVLLLSALAIAFGREPDGRRVPSLFTIGLALLASVGACSVVRLLPLAILVLVPLAAKRLAWFVRPSTIVQHACAMAPLLAAAWLGLSVKLAPSANFDASWLPVAATQYAEQIAPRGQLYNFMPFGGYLAWQLHPRYRVFNDGRNQLARPAAFIARAALAQREPAAFDAMVEDFALEWAVTRAADGEHFDLPLAQSPRWTMLYIDDVAAVYVRNEGPNRDLAATGYRLLRHSMAPDAILHLALTRRDLADALAHDGARAVMQAPQSPRAAFFDACGGLAIGDPSQFERGLRRLADLDPNHPAVTVLLRARRMQPARGDQ